VWNCREKGLLGTCGAVEEAIMLNVVLKKPDSGDVECIQVTQDSAQYYILTLLHLVVSEKLWVWNGVHSASRGSLRNCLKEEVDALVYGRGDSSS
jgi:hypothetical protein